MKPLSHNLFMTFTDDDSDIGNADTVQYAPGLQMGLTTGHAVSSYIELLRKVAALTYWNSRFRLLYRGQTKDYKIRNDGSGSERSSLYPSILRPASEGNVHRATLDERFDTLKKAEVALKKNLLIGDIHRDRPAQWALLQHYEVCATPFMDLTNSIQTALSFALSDSSNTGYLYVFAFPQLSGAVSVSVESMTQVIDLSQVCYPEALRPHFQNAFLATDYPLYSSRAETHGQSGTVGNSLVCRLLAKFRLENSDRWTSEGFTRTPNKLLFPNEHDKWFGIFENVKADLKSTLTSTSTGAANPGDAKINT
jgi:FRG domain